MILVEECKLRLDESIEPWLPELANRRVLQSISSGTDDAVPALRSITARDLLTYRMGFGSVMALPNTYPIQKFIREYRIGGDGPMLPSEVPDMNEWLRRFGSLPWLAQPGERPIRLDWRLRHDRLHRPCGGNHRHLFHAAHDGFARTAEGIQRLLDTRVWGT